MLGIEQPLFEQGSVEFILFVLMLAAVSFVIWITISK